MFYFPHTMYLERKLSVVLSVMRIFGILIIIVSTKAITGTREKLIHVITPGSYQTVSLSDYCIKPSDQQTLTFDVKAPYDAIINLVTTAGIASTFYEIVIGGNANRVCMIRRSNLSKIGTKVYQFIENLLDENEYRQFWISWLGGHIKAGRGHVPNLESTVLLKWHDTNPLSVSSLYLKSASVVEFIVHDKNENPAFFTKLPWKYVSSEILATSTLISEIQCAMRCYIHTNCNRFNFKRSSEMCELVQGRTRDMQDNTEYDLYSEC